MTVSTSFHVIMAIILIGTFGTMFIPLLENWKFISLEDSPPIVVAVQSSEYQNSLIFSLSVSVPTFLELLLRIFAKAKMEYVLPNAIILASLTIPDLIILTYVRVFLDLNALNYLFKARLLLFMWVASIFIQKYGGKYWSSRDLIISFAFLSAGRITAFYNGYYSSNINDMLNILGTTSDVISFAIFIIISVKWYRFIFTETKFVTMTNYQYLCNIYVTAVAMSCSGIYINKFSSKTTIDWYDWGKKELIFYTLMFTAFHLFVMLFDGRALLIEMLQTKVCKYAVGWYEIIIHIYTFRWSSRRNPCSSVTFYMRFVTLSTQCN